MRVRELGAARAAELRRLVSPYILRREKDKVLGTDSSGAAAAGSSAGSSSSAAAARGGGAGSDGVVAAATLAAAGGTSSSAAAGTPPQPAAAAAGGVGPPRPAAMGSKTDLVVWLRLTPLQRHIYEAFLHSDAVKAALNSTKSPLAALTVLKKVCDHPALLSERATKLVVSGGWARGLVADLVAGRVSLGHDWAAAGLALPRHVLGGGCLSVCCWGMAGRLLLGHGCTAAAGLLL